MNFQNFTSSKLEHFFLPLCLAVGGFLFGLIFEKILLVRLKAFARKTTWEYGDILIFALEGYTTFWFSLLGFYLASFQLPFSENSSIYMRKVLSVLTILSVTFFTAKITVGIVYQYTKKSGVLSTTSIFGNLTRIIIYSVGILIILDSLGISITPILTALGVGGLAVALALQDTLANFFAGIHILFSRQIRPKDYIKLDTGEEGTVHDIGWRNTTMTTGQDNLVVIPNVKIASAKVTNFHLPELEMSVSVPVIVSYNSDLDKVEKVSIEVAKEILNEIPGGIKTFEPFVRYAAFEINGISLNVFLRTDEFSDQFLMKHEFIKRILVRFKKENIEIPYPTSTVYIKNQSL